MAKSSLDGFHAESEAIVRCMGFGLNKNETVSVMRDDMLTPECEALILQADLGPLLKEFLDQLDPPGDMQPPVTE